MKHMISLTDVTLRDGISRSNIIVPTNKKIRFAQLVLKAGFTMVEVTEFGSRNLQYKDSKAVLDGLEQYAQKLRVMCNRVHFINKLLLSQLQCIVFVIGVDDCEVSRHSRTGNQALQEALSVCQLVKSKGRSFLVVLSGAFGKENGKTPESLNSMIDALATSNIKDVTLADPYGTAPLQTVQDVWQSVTRSYPELKFTLHFHGPHAIENIKVTYEMGARSFEVAFRNNNNYFSDPRPNANAAEVIQMLRRCGEKDIPSEEHIQEILNMWQSL